MAFRNHPENAIADVVFHSTPLGARSSRHGVLATVLHNWETHEQRQISAIRSDMKTPIPKQKPSQNLSPVQNMMSATLDSYWLIRLQQINLPRLGAIHSKEEDDILTVELTSDRYGRKRIVPIVLADGVARIAASDPYVGIGK
jgi:hypothetical protein